MVKITEPDGTVIETGKDRKELTELETHKTLVDKFAGFVDTEAIKLVDVKGDEKADFVTDNNLGTPGTNHELSEFCSKFSSGAEQNPQTSRFISTFVMLDKLKKVADGKKPLSYLAKLDPEIDPGAVTAQSLDSVLLIDAATEIAAGFDVLKARTYEEIAAAHKQGDTATLAKKEALDSMDAKIREEIAKVVNMATEERIEKIAEKPSHERSKTENELLRNAAMHFQLQRWVEYARPLLEESKDQDRPDEDLGKWRKKELTPQQSRSGFMRKFDNFVKKFIDENIPGTKKMSLRTAEAAAFITLGVAGSLISPVLGGVIGLGAGVPKAFSELSSGLKERRAATNQAKKFKYQNRVNEHFEEQLWTEDQLTSEFDNIVQALESEEETDDTPGLKKVGGKALTKVKSLIKDNKSNGLSPFTLPSLHPENTEPQKNKAEWVMKEKTEEDADGNDIDRYTYAEGKPEADTERQRVEQEISELERRGPKGRRWWQWLGAGALVLVLSAGGASISYQAGKYFEGKPEDDGERTEEVDGEGNELNDDNNEQNTQPEATGIYPCGDYTVAECEAIVSGRDDLFDFQITEPTPGYEVGQIINVNPRPNDEGQ